MSRTATQIAAIVQSRIGNRVNGVFGTRSVEDVILDSINDGIYTIVEQDETNAIRFVRKKATIAVTDAAYEYAFPTTDIDSETIRIKSILNITAFILSDDYGWKLMQLSQRRRDQMFPFTNDSLTGRPSYFCPYGENIEIYPYPDQSYTLNLNVSVWPDRIAINEEQPLGSEFDKTIADYATFDVFRTAQLTEDAAFWLKAFDMSLTSVMQSATRNPDWAPSGEQALYLPNQLNPGADPFTRSNPQA